VLLYLTHIIEHECGTGFQWNIISKIVASLGLHGNGDKFYEYLQWYKNHFVFLFIFLSLSW